MVRRVIGIVAGLGMCAGVAMADEGRPLSMETVDQVIESHNRAFQPCLRGNVKKDGAITLHLDIDAAGKVVAADKDPHAQDAAAGSATEKCIARVVRKMKFPATGVISHVEYPFMLAGR